MSKSSRQLPGSACDECRSRKLRCDRQRPQCGTCSDAGIPCKVNTKPVRRGPKKGVLKALRSRVGMWCYSHSGHCPKKCNTEAAVNIRVLQCLSRAAFSHSKMMCNTIRSSTMRKTRTSVQKTQAPMRSRACVPAASPSPTMSYLRQSGLGPILWLPCYQIRLQCFRVPSCLN